MKTIHKIAAVVIEDDTFLMVRKVGKDIWTSLGGKPKTGETEAQALLREIKEELGCDAIVKRKIGDFEAPAVFDDAIVKLSTYLVTLKGTPKIVDPEQEEFRFITKDWEKDGIKLPDSISQQVIPHCIKEGLLSW